MRSSYGSLENNGKGLYTAGGYAGLINYYIQHGHSPAAWKAVNCGKPRPAMAAPLQAITEISLGVLLLIGLLTRPAAFVAFLYLAQPLDFGVGHLVDMGIAGPDDRLARRSPWARWSSVEGVDAGWHSEVVPRRRGGDRTNLTCECRSSSLPTTKHTAISASLADLPADLVTEVVVVDSNSSDGTPHRRPDGCTR